MPRTPTFILDECTEPMPVNDWLSYNARHDDRLPEDMQLRIIRAGENGAPFAFQAAFDFLQRHADGRYSDRTLMAVSRWVMYSQEMANGTMSGMQAVTLPTVFLLSKEVSYDEVTEVKSGGTIGVAVTLSADDGARLVLAVAPASRRQGFGSLLLHYARDYSNNLHSWVGNSNLDGQMFLLSQGLRPVAMNRRQALQFAWGDLPADDGVAL